MTVSGPPSSSDSIARLAKWPNDAVGSSIRWFRDQFQSLGIPIRADCALYAALVRLDELKGLLDMQIAKRFASLDDMVNFNAEADGADFLSKMLHRGTLAGLALDRRRWRHLVCGNPIPTMTAPSSLERNLAWETVLACAMATFCKNVRFVEPDVMGEFEGHDFGVAAKVAYSPRNLWENVGKGATQANGRSSAALIFVNVVGLLPLAEMFQASQSLGGAEEIREWIDDWACRWYKRPEVIAMAAELQQTVKNPIGVAFFMPFVVQAERQPVPCFYTHMPIVWGADDDSPDYRFARAFLDACNTVLGFQSPISAVGSAEGGATL